MGKKLDGKTLQDIANEAGLSHEEFINEVCLSYASIMDLRMDNAPDGSVISHSIQFSTHTLVIDIHRETIH